MSERIFVAYSAQERGVPSSTINEWLEENIPAAEIEDPSINPAPPENLRAFLRDSIARADKLLVVWSKDASSSPHIQYQVGLAEALEKPIWVLRTEDAPEELPVRLSGASLFSLDDRKPNPPITPKLSTVEIENSIDPESLPVRSPRIDPLELQKGDLVDHFRVKRLLGAGGMGRVYLARDQDLGRQVALKLVAPQLKRAGRFLEEARNTAKCNHPNIVTIHSVGYHGEVPYLALEYLEGESLRDRSGRGPLTVRETVRIAHDIALAIEHAHKSRVLHCDLKPANIMIPNDGRLRVVDFGLAKAVGEGLGDLSGGWRGGTPPYMAPEQWSSEELQAAVDIFALGVIVFELLENRHPYFDKSALQDIMQARPPVYNTAAIRFERTDISAALQNLVRACLEIDPRRRPNAKVVVEDLKKLLDEAVDQAPLAKIPFRGLLPFDEEHARDFFGRTDEIAACIERLREQTMLSVVGPSGGGKSSFVRAGIIPRLREQGRLFVVSFQPGITPLRTLSAHLVAATEASSTSAARSNRAAVEEMERRLRANPTSTAAVLSDIAQRERARVLLYVDQFEEVFTQGAPQEDAAQFIEAISAAADDPKDPIRVIVTMREDFLGRLPPSPLVQRAFGQVLVIRNMDHDELRETIIRPLANRGYAFDDPKIVDEMLVAVAPEVAGLPMLEFACRILWEKHDPAIEHIARGELDAIGGVTGALALHAQKVLETFSDEERKLARSLFLDLVNPDGSRRVRTREALIFRLGDQLQM